MAPASSPPAPDVAALCPELHEGLTNLAQQEGSARAAGAENIARLQTLRGNMNLAMKRLTRALLSADTESPEYEKLSEEYKRAVASRTLADNALGIAFAQDRQLGTPSPDAASGNGSKGGFRRSAGGDRHRRRRQ